MSDLISRTDALEALKDMPVTYDAETVQRCIEAVSNLPTIDAVPVVRCKDCKWYYRGGATCMFWDGTNSMCGDDYCSRAEREEE